MLIRDSDPGDPHSLERIAARLALLVSSVEAAWGAHDDEAVGAGASELLAEIEPLQREGRASGRPQLLWYSHLPGRGAGIWLVERAANSILKQLGSSTPDWDLIGASSSFAESGVLQLQDAINGKSFDEEELREALAQTVTWIEERLQNSDLSPDTRELLTWQLRYMQDRGRAK